MSKKSELFKGIEYPLEGAVAVVAGPELIERIIEEYGTEYMVKVADMPLAEQFVGGAQTLGVGLAAFLIAWESIKYMGRAIKGDKGKRTPLSTLN
jgi:hypothetical protein